MKRELSNQQLAAYLIAFFGEGKEYVMTNDPVVACNCNKPRGYWFGMPLIHQRQPNIIRLDKVVVINASAKVYIRHASCPHCETIFFKPDKVKEENHAQPNQVRRELAQAPQSEN